MIESVPKFVQGIFNFTGAGYDKPALLGSHQVASNRRAQTIYFRAGNSSDQLIVLSLHKDGTPMRLFPVGARSAEHVTLGIVEDIFPESRVDVLVSAPEGVSGTVVLDLGMVEI